MTPQRPLNAEDQQILSEICAPDADITVKIGKDQQPDEVLRYLYIFTRAEQSLQRKRDGIVMVIGRLLHVIKERPEIYQAGGFNSFDHFVKQHVTVMLGMSNSTLRDATRIYEAFPGVLPREVAEVGTAKMRLLAMATNSTQPGHLKMIQEAKTQTVREVREMVAVKANMPVTETIRGSVFIPCTLAQQYMWRRFLAEPGVMAHCGTEDPGMILEYLMAEVMGEWCGEESTFDAGQVCVSGDPLPVNGH